MTAINAIERTWFSRFININPLSPLIYAITILITVPIASAHAQTSTNWNQVVDAAKREGKLVVYDGAAPVVPRIISKLFEEKYGIAVERIEGRPAEIRERIRSEQATGRSIGDLHLSGVTTGALFAAGGFYQPHGGLPNGVRLKPAFPDDGTLIAGSLERFVILANRNLVKPEDEPRGWHDMLDPKWKGRFIANDPSAAGGGQGSFAVFYEKFGADFVERLAAQQPVLDRDSRVAERRVAQGEYPIFLPFTVADLSILEGLPVKAIPPKEGSPYITTVLATLKNAPHPNAARLFMNFYLEDESQLQYILKGVEGTTDFRSDKAPEATRELVGNPLLGQADPFKLDAMAKTLADMFKK